MSAAVAAPPSPRTPGLPPPANVEKITVVVPEFVVGSWWGQLLHNQSALLLKGRLLFRKGTVVTSVPYHLN